MPRKRKGPACAKGEANRNAFAKPDRYSAKAITGTRPLNRHERRQIKAGIEALMAEAKGVYTFEVVGGIDVLLHPLANTLALMMGQWLTTPPMCLCCEHDFARQELPLPLWFVLLRPWQQPDAVKASVSALCEECALHPDRNERIVAALRTVWPDARQFEPHAAPGGVQ